MSAGHGMPLSPGAGAFAELLVGPGFYKLGYVTTDREAAIERLSAEQGFDEWARFDPALTVTAEDGTTGPSSLRCAFSAGRDLVVEVMEPIDGAVGIFREPLTDAEDLRIAFHHVGVLVDDFDAAMATATAAGAVPVWSADVPNGMRVAYLRVPLLGHLLEIVYYGRESGAFLTSLRGPRR